MNNIDRRIDKNVVVEDNIYFNALLHLCETIIPTFKDFLEKEGRFSGLAKSYVHSIQETFSYINEEVEDKEFEIYEKIIYIFKPTILKEFNYLKSRRLSEGDSIIIILRKIMEILIDSSPSDYEYIRRMKTIHKILSKFYENIKNTKKSAKLFQLSDNLKYCIEKTAVGKYPLSKIDFSDNYKKVRGGEILTNPGSRMLDDSENKISEISW